MSIKRSNFIEAVLIALLLFSGTGIAKRNNEARERETAEAARIQDDLLHPKQPDIAGRAVRGNPEAPVLLVAYSDFQCPYCRRAFKTIEGIRKKYGEKLRYVYKHLPLTSHPFARPAATYFEAIAMQDAEKAYRFHDELFRHPDQLDREGRRFAERVARELKVDIKRLRKDAVSKAVNDRIDADIAEARKWGFSGTPCFVAGGIRLRGALPASIFEAVIEKRLQESTDKKPREVSGKR